MINIHNIYIYICIIICVYIYREIAGAHHIYICLGYRLIAMDLLSRWAIQKVVWGMVLVGDSWIYHLVMTFTVCHGKIHHAIKRTVFTIYFD